MGAAGNPGLREYLKAFKDGFFPLRMTVTKGGKTVMTQEAVKIEPGSLPEDLFAPPAGYTELKMPGLPGLPGKRP